MSIPRIAFIGIFAATLTACDERIYSEYENIAQAKEDRAFDRGWLPEWIPDDATDIHELHNLDTNVSAISFTLNEPSEFKWPDKCVLAGNADRPRIRTTLFPRAVQDLEGVQDCDGLFAVIDADGKVHIWRNRWP